MDREQFYKEHIRPLMMHIADIADKHSVPYLALFEMDDKTLQIHHSSLNGSEKITEILLYTIEPPTQKDGVVWPRDATNATR